MGYGVFVAEAINEIEQFYNDHVVEKEVTASIDGETQKRLENSFCVTITRKKHSTLLVKGVLAEAAIQCIYQLCGSAGKGDAGPVEWKKFEGDVLKTKSLGKQCALKKLRPSGTE